MSLRIFETKWKKALASILDDLKTSELRKLMSNLEKIPQGEKPEKPEKHREKLPDIIIKHYGPEGSISVIDKEMKELPRNDARVQEPLQRSVDELKKRRQKIKETAKKPATESGSVEKPKPAAGTTSKPASSASASVAKEPKPAVGLKSCQLVKMDPVGAKKPKQKTERQESLDLSSLSLESAESTKTSKGQSDAVQTGRIKIISIKSINKKNTHLEVEFNGGPHEFFMTTRLLAEVFGVKAEDDFKETFSRKLPLTAEAQIQGNKITEIKKL